MPNPYSRADWTEFQLRFRPPRDGPSVSTRLRDYATAEEIGGGVAALQLLRRELSVSGSLGSANDFRDLAQKEAWSGRHLQLFSNGRVLQTIGSRSPVIVGSRRPEAICVTAEPASVLNRHRC